MAKQWNLGLNLSDSVFHFKQNLIVKKSKYLSLNKHDNALFCWFYLTLSFR